MKKNTVTGFMLLALALGGAYNANAQTPEQRQEIIKNYDLEKIEALKARLKEKGEQNYKRALELAEVNNWPLRKEEKGRAAILTGVTPDNHPIYKYTDNVGAAFTARVTDIRTDGALGLDVNGQNMIVGMWEIGYPRPTHVDLTGRITFKDGDSFEIAEKDTEEAIHATHVAATMIGTGTGDAAAQGLAYQAQGLWSYDAFLDDFEALGAAGEGLLVSNHSYGRPMETLSASEEWMPGAYIGESADWDELMAAAPYYQAVISAGNDRNDDERDELIGNKNSKNAIVVAAVHGLGLNGYVDKNSVQMSSFSSFGPSDDRRVKPDISAKGVAVWSASSQENNSYASLQGTSMAAPGVAASLLLMQQHYFAEKGQYMKAATLRGLMINTADEAGASAGPDFKFGWGLINTTRAVQLISNEGITSLIEEKSLSQGETYTKDVVATGNNTPLEVTIAWTDIAGPVNTGTANSTTPVLMNDLDVRVTQNGVTHMPWKLNSIAQLPAQKADNTVDNVEVIEIENPQAGQTYTITVSHKGVLEDFQAQNFSLIVNGIGASAGISDNALNNMVSVYPNPANDVINILLDSSLSTDDCTIIMYDLQGRVVKQFSSFVESINVAELAAGMYMLNITKDGAVSSKKIMIK